MVTYSGESSLDRAAVTQAIREILSAKVVSIQEPGSDACNADMKACCVFLFSRFLCHGDMLNSALRDGTGWFTTRRKIKPDEVFGGMGVTG